MFSCLKVLTGTWALSDSREEEPSKTLPPAHELLVKTKQKQDEDVIWDLCDSDSSGYTDDSFGGALLKGCCGHTEKQTNNYATWKKYR